jgi:hypothetical protein
MAKKRPMTWLPSPIRPKKASIGTALLKAEVDAKVQTFVDIVLRPKFVLPPSERPKPPLNHIADVTTKWVGGSLYFISTYACPGPTAISPTFEHKFARMVFVGNGQFNLSFIRYTGKWVELYSRLSLDECLKAIDTDYWFQPE